MAEIEFPKEDLDTLLKVADLQEVDKEKIILILSEYKKSEPQETVLSEILNLTQLDSDSAEEFFNAFLALIRTKHKYKLTNEEVINDVDESIREIGEYSEPDRIKLNAWISKLLNINNKDILASTLAYNYVASNSNLFYYANAYEELRPVFTDDNLSGLAVYHTLKFHYELPDKRHSDIYFTLDSNDIDNLIEVLKKTRSRVEMLKSQYKKDLINI